MIGAHNALSGYKPLKWWMRPFSFLYKCQTKTITRLIDDGVTFFDIRVSFNGNKAIGSHGLAKFDAEATSYINLICFNVEEPVIRIILENGNEEDKVKFKEWAHLLQIYQPNAKFIGGNYKPTWERLVEFTNDDVHDNIIQYVGSMQTWWGKIFPRLYAKLNNKKNLKIAKANPDKYYLFDYL